MELERKGRGGEDTGQVFEVGYRGLEVHTEVRGEEGNTEQNIEGEGRNEGVE